jgi:hypothetical protein
MHGRHRTHYVSHTISLSQLEADIAKPVRLSAMGQPEGPHFLLLDPPAFSDTSLKVADLALALHVVGYRELHTHERVHLAKKALRANYIWTAPLNVAAEKKHHESLPSSPEQSARRRFAVPHGG